MASTAAGQLLLIAATPLLTRLYAPDDFGVFGVFWAMISVVAVISSLRYEIAIPLPPRDLNARHLLVLALVINAIVAILAFFTVLLLHDPIVRWTGAPGLATCLWLLPPGLLFVGSYKAFNYWAIRNRDYTRIGKTRILQSCTNVSVQLGAGFMGAGAVGMVSGQLLGQIMGISSLARGLKLRAFCASPLFSLKRMRILIRRYRRFPLYDVPASAVDVLSVQLPPLLLTAFFGPTVAGFYILAERVLGMPAGLLAQAIGQVLYGSVRHAMEKQQLHRLTLRIVLGLGGLVLIPAIILTLSGESLFNWVFGSPWRNAGLYAICMVWGLCAQVIYSPLSMILMATEGQKTNLLIHSTLLLLKILAIAYGYSQQNPVLAVMGFSLAGMVGYGLGIAIILRRTKRLSLPKG